MERADEAFAAKRRFDFDAANKLFRVAFELEREAAHAIVMEQAPEPTRSVLLRSAATLALDCGEHREAEQLSCLALSGSPPAPICEELRELLAQVKLSRYLSECGTTIDPGTLRLSLAGNAVGHGVAGFAHVFDRVDATKKLLIRSVERLQGRPFRERGRPARAVKEQFNVFLSAPRAGSFAISMRVGTKDVQRALAGFVDPARVIDDFLTCIEAFSSEDQDGLRRRVPQPAYFRNFTELAKTLCPDGSRVKSVVFAMKRGPGYRAVALTGPAPRSWFPRAAPEETHVVIEGRLLYADSLKAKKQRIKLVDDSGSQHAVTVPEGMMNDIVKPLWDVRVRAQGVTQSDGTIRMLSIDAAPEED